MDRPMGDVSVKKFFAVAAVLVFVWFPLVAVPAGAEPVDPFVGHWAGMGITENGTPAENIGFVDRELDVTIEATSNGFNITWKTLRLSVGDRKRKVKHTSLNVPFVQTDRPGIYRMDADGEPISGSPYIWARVADNRLEVHSITISERGVLEYQKYVRTLLLDDEMQLRFTRSLDGSIVRSVLAHLRRQ